MEDINTKAPEAPAATEAAEAQTAAETAGASTEHENDGAQVVAKIASYMAATRALFIIEIQINALIENCPAGLQYEDLRRLSPVFHAVNGEMRFSWTDEAPTDEKAESEGQSKLHMRFHSSDVKFDAAQIDPLETNYARAVLSLLEAEDHAAVIAQAAGISCFPIKRGAVSIFFVEHPDIDPAGPCTLESGHFEEIRTIYDQLEALFTVLYAGVSAADKVSIEDLKFPEGSEFVSQSVSSQDIEYLRSSEGGYSYFLSFAIPHITGWRPEQPAGQPAPTKAMQTIAATPPDKYTAINNRLVGALGDLITIGEPRNLNAGQNYKLTAYASAVLLDEEGQKIAGKFSPFDRAVLDAVTSLYLYGNQSHDMTADMIYRTMRGMKNTEHVSPAQRATVTKSVEKLRRILIDVDATEEAKAKKWVDENGDPIESLRYNDFIISAIRRDKKAGGRTVTAWHLKSEPLPMAYARYSKQYLTYEPELRDVKKVDSTGSLTTKSIPLSENRLVVHDYILRRVLVMKYDIEAAAKQNAHLKQGQKPKKPRQSPHILFSKLLKETGNEKASQTEQKRIRDFSLLSLDFLRAKKVIKGYDKIIEGRKIVGVDIKF